MTPDVLAVGGGRDGAREAGERRRDTVGDERAVEAGVFREVLADDVSGDDEVADVLGDNDERGGQDDEDHVCLKFREGEVRQGEDWSGRDFREVDEAESHRREVADDDRDKDRDDGEELAEDDVAEDGDAEGDERDGDDACVHRDSRGGEEACHAGGGTGEVEADEGDDRAHRGGREDDVDPAGARELDDEGDDDEADADDYVAAERVAEGARGDSAHRGENREGRREEGEARAEKGGGFSLANEEINQGADSVHEQNDGRVDAEEHRDEDRGAEHGKEVLEAKGEAFGETDLLVNLDDGSRHCKLLWKNFFIPDLGVISVIPYFLSI